MWDSDDDSWEYVAKKTPSVEKVVLFIRNLDLDTTEYRFTRIHIPEKSKSADKKNQTFLTARSFCRRKPDGKKHGGGGGAARVTVDAEAQLPDSPGCILRTRYARPNYSL